MSGVQFSSGGTAHPLFFCFFRKCTIEYRTCKNKKTCFKKFAKKRRAAKAGEAIFDQPLLPSSKFYKRTYSSDVEVVFKQLVKLLLCEQAPVPFGNAIGFGFIVIEEEVAGADRKSAAFSKGSGLADVEPDECGFTGIVSRHFLENRFLLAAFA